MDDFRIPGCKIRKLRDKILGSDDKKGSVVYLTKDDKLLVLDAIQHFSDGEYYFESCTCDYCKMYREMANR